MTENSKVALEQTKEEVDQIILPATQCIVQQYTEYINELECLFLLIALMLKDIADAFEAPKTDRGSDFFW